MIRRADLMASSICYQPRWEPSATWRWTDAPARILLAWSADLWPIPDPAQIAADVRAMVRRATGG